MAKSETFQLDTAAAESILTDLASGIVKESAQAIAQRANSMAGSISRDPPTFEVYTSIGSIVRGKRAIGTVKAVARDTRQRYVAHQALTKARDAGRV